ncbi:RecB family exonuclease, partial [Candidatus Omnitrophota bacterium]
GLKEKEEISEDFEAADVGNFMHSLLRDFYSQFLNKRVRLDAETGGYLFELKEKKIKEFFPQDTGELFLLSRIIDYKLKNFLKQEAARKEKIKILYLEQELPVEPGKITIDTISGPVSLRGKLDRVDERILGKIRKIVILDYKTGVYRLPRKGVYEDSLVSRQEIKKAIGSFQLPIYIYLFSQSSDIAPQAGLEASFYSLRDIKEEFLFGQGHPGNLSALYLEAMKGILAEIMSPDCAFVRDDSDEHYCRWCHFSALCKRQ